MGFGMGALGALMFTNSLLTIGIAVATLRHG